MHKSNNEKIAKIRQTIKSGMAMPSLFPKKFLAHEEANKEIPVLNSSTGSTSKTSYP